jgi:hypothetical protein
MEVLVASNRSFGSITRSLFLQKYILRLGAVANVGAQHTRVLQRSHDFAHEDYNDGIVKSERELALYSLVV